jgi:23S rRNA (pseudouridine1915-N3)-methyltransferase
MQLRLSTIKGSTTPWADTAAADYGKRIQRYFRFEEQCWKPAEEARFWEDVPPRTRCILLDERGLELSSPGLADLIEESAKNGVYSLHFAIGGAYGHPVLAREKSFKMIRLSSMVLNHAVARVVLLEQLYRACTIRAGEPYHHAG